MTDDFRFKLGIMLRFKLRFSRPHKYKVLLIAGTKNKQTNRFNGATLSLTSLTSCSVSSWESATGLERGI